MSEITIANICFLLAGYILATVVAGEFIAMVLRSMLKSVDAADIPRLKGGFSKMGKYIGWLERALALTFIMVGQYNGIGFVLAAKSILRFGEIKQEGDRKFAEYVILGTLLSFTTAMITGVVLRLVLKMP